MTIYFCKRCREYRQPVIEHGGEKCRRFRTGFVGRFLQCKHIIPATQNAAEFPVLGDQKAA